MKAARTRTAHRRRATAAAAVITALGLGVPAVAMTAGPMARTTLTLQPDGQWLASIPLRGGGQVRVPLPPLPAGRHYDPATITAKRLPSSSPAPQAPSATSPTVEAATAGVTGPLDAATYPAKASRAPGTVVTVAGGSCDGYSGLDATISPMRVDFGSDHRLVWTDDGMSRGPDPQINSYWFWIRPENIGHDQGSETARTLDAEGRVRTIGTQYTPSDGRNWRDMGSTSLDASFFYDAISDGHGGTLLDVDLPEGIDTASLEGANVRDLPGSNAIVDVDAHGVRHLVVGGRPLSGALVQTQQTSYGDGSRATDTVLGTVESFTTDAHGNIYLADAVTPESAGSAGYVRIRFVNRTTQPVTFYSGTPYATTIQPGTIGTIAGPGSYPIIGPIAPGTNPRTLLDGAPSGNGFPAKLATFAVVPKLVVRGDVLYLLDQFHTFTDAFDERSNLEIRAVNLGVSQPGPLLVAGTPIPVGNIDRVAGDDTTNWGYVGDGGPARNAKFNVELQVGPTGDFAVDHEGDIYIADSNNNRIRRVDAITGVILTVAGSGLTGASPANAPALLTTLNEPFGITIDDHDRPVIGEYLGKVIRRLDETSLTSLATATLTTLVGRGPTPCGDGHLATGRTMAAGAQFGQIYDLATDSRGDTFVADGEYETIRRISPQGRIDEVIGQAVPCSSPIRSPQPQCPDSGPQSVDPGPLSAAQLANPNYVLVDRYDNLFVSDVDRVRYINFGSKPVVVLGATVAPRSIATIQAFPGRRISVSVGVPAVNFTVDVPIGGLALDGQGQLYVADPLLDVVYRISRCGQSEIVAGNGQAPASNGQGDGGAATAASLVPQALLWDQYRHVLLISTDPALPFGDEDTPLSSGEPQGSPRIRAVNFTSQALPVFGRLLAPGTIDTVVGAGQCVQAACSYGDGGSAYRAAISSASSMALGPGHRLYLVDAADNRIRVVLPTGEIAGLSSPWPEVTSCTGCNRTVQSPDGYLGDGGRAFDAWFDFRLLWQAGEERASLGAIAVTRNGDLLVGDHTGRIRKILNPLHAPLRLSDSVPGVPGAGVGVTASLPLYENATAAVSSSGYAWPQIVSKDGVQYVVAARGAGRGCDLWKVATTRVGAPDPSYQGEPLTSVSGAGPGGSSCHLTSANDTLAIASPVRSDDTGSQPMSGAELGVAVAASTDGASTWRPGVAGLLPLREGTQLGRLALGVAGGAFHLAYRTSAGAAIVASSTDASTYGPEGETAVGQGAEMLGDVTAGPHGTQLLAVVTGGGTLVDPRQDVVVARRDATGHWSQVTVAAEPDSGSLRLSPPSLALDSGGTAYLTWSDDRTVYLTHSRDGLHWTKPVVLTRRTAVLPSIVAGPAGHVMVGYYVAPAARTTSADDPYAEWYVGLTRSTDANTARPHFASRLASSGAVHYGAMCLAYDICSETDLASPTVSTSAPGPAPAYGTGPVRLAVGDDGRVVAAFAIDSGMQGNTSGIPVVGYLRDCVDHLTKASKASPCRVQQPVATQPPAGVPSVTPPVLPQLPLQTCAPPPPAPAKPAPRPAPAHQPQQRPGHSAPTQHDEGPLAVVPPLVVEPPLEPALPPGQAPAQANQLSQASQPGSAPQTGIQPGMAAAEELEAQKARSYAYAATRRAGPALPPLAVWWVAAGGFALVGWAARRPRRAAPARCRVHVPAQSSNHQWRRGR